MRRFLVGSGIVFGLIGVLWVADWHLNAGERHLLDKLNDRPSPAIQSVTIIVSREYRRFCFSFTTQHLTGEWDRLFRTHSRRYQHCQWGGYCKVVVEFVDGTGWIGDGYIREDLLHVVVESAGPIEGHWPTHAVVIPKRVLSLFEHRWRKLNLFVHEPLRS